MDKISSTNLTPALTNTSRSSAPSPDPDLDDASSKRQATR